MKTQNKEVQCPTDNSFTILEMVSPIVAKENFSEYELFIYNDETDEIRSVGNVNEIAAINNNECILRSRFFESEP